MKLWLVKLLRSLKYFAAVMCIGFLVLFFTAPVIFGKVIISAAAVGSIFIYAFIGQLLGFITEEAVLEKKSFFNKEPHMHKRAADGHAEASRHAREGEDYKGC